ncbi:BatD family protein [Longitalea luteola]|uniref:BatD family protein n=1 Tax=Longitalea luteola TaxID=2812563 RepID=UPI001A971415|nr:BatD family protein [Longitalea luteola]
MKNPILYITLIGSLLTSPLYMFGQVMARASVNRDQILIGEPITLTFEVRIPMGQSLTWFNLDTIPHFEIIEAGKLDTNDNIDGKQYHQELTITSFDSGTMVIPPLVLKVEGKSYATDSIPIEVAYTKDDLSKDYRDIKDIVEVPKPAWMAWIPWIIGVVTVIAAGVIVYLLKKPKQAPPPPSPAPRLSAYEEALQALEELRKQGLQNGEVKTYYSRLNDILRVFLFRKMKVATLEKTNEELIAQLRQMPMDKETFNQLVKALQIADFVKFARYQPDASDNEKNFAVIQSAIKTLNNIS